MHFRHCPRCNLKSIQKHGKESQWKNLQQKGLQKRWVFKICCFILNFYEIPTFPSAMLMEVRVCCRAGSWWLPGWRSCLGSGVTRHSVRSHSGPPSFPASPWARHQQREQLCDSFFMTCGGMRTVSLRCGRNFSWVVSVQILNYLGRLGKVSSQGSYLRVNQWAHKKNSAWSRRRRI